MQTHLCRCGLTNGIEFGSKTSRIYLICTMPSTRVGVRKQNMDQARPPVTDGVLARAVAQLRNKRDVGTDELKALPDVAIANLASL